MVRPPKKENHDYNVFQHNSDEQFYLEPKKNVGINVIDELEVVEFSEVEQEGDEDLELITDSSSNEEDTRDTTTVL